MALSQEALDFKQTYKIKPLFYCPHTDHALSYYFINPEDILKCDLKGCLCHGIGGWVAKCPECGIALHNCLWGCKAAVPILHGKHNEPINKRLIKELKQHQWSKHYNQPRTWEY